MVKLTTIALILITIDCLKAVKLNKSESCPNEKTAVNFIRKRRHLVFPDKANVIATITTAAAFMTHAPSGWNLVIELDILTPLPDRNFTSSHLRRKLHHRQKRQFWESITNALVSHNFDGKECLKRTICETNALLPPQGKSIVYDILRALFRAEFHEIDFIEEMRGYNDELLNPNFCDVPSNCPISILDILLKFNSNK